MKTVKIVELNEPVLLKPTQSTVDNTDTWMYSLTDDTPSANDRIALSVSDYLKITPK